MSEQLANLLKLGLDHLREGRLREAVGAWEEVLRQDPGNRRAQHFLDEALSGAFSLQTEPVLATPKPNWEPQSHQNAEETLTPRPSSFSPSTAEQVPEEGGWIGIDDQEFATGSTQPKPLTAPNTEVELANPGEFWNGSSDGAEAVQGAQGAAEFELEDGLVDIELDDAQSDYSSEDSGSEGWAGESEATAEQAANFPQLEDREQVPRVVVSPGELVWQKLDSTQGFLLSLIDGQSSLDELFAISNLPEEESARLMISLLEAGIIELE